MGKYRTVKAYFLTYKHINGHLIRKQLTELDIPEVYESPFVAEVIAKTEINFSNFQESLKQHEQKEQKYIMETAKPQH
jgi:hypothetical protein